MNTDTAGFTGPTCPDCGGPVESDDEQLVVCQECAGRFQVVLVPIDRRSLYRCPTCAGDVRMGPSLGGPLVCDSCERRWGIRERTWLDPAATTDNDQDD